MKCWVKQSKKAEKQVIESFAGKFTIGAVLFRDTQRQRVPMLLGDPRVAMLRKFYQKHDLGNFEPYVMGVGVIAWDDVVWESAGARVTQAGEQAEMRAVYAMDNLA
jgi:hypothetical protein